MAPLAKIMVLAIRLMFTRTTDEQMAFVTREILEANKHLKNYPWSPQTATTASPTGKKKVPRVPLLKGADNWDAWKILAEKQLKSLRLGHTIKAGADVDDDDQQIAFSHILSWVDTSLQRPITYCQTAQSAWNILCKTYDKKDFAHSSEIILEWMDTKRSDFDTLDDFFKGFHNRLAAVIDIGITVPDEMCCAKFLQCVKDDLPIWTQSIKNSAHNGYKPTLNKLMAVALAEASDESQYLPVQLATLRLTAVTSANKGNGKNK
ncbi:uncharacterized protein K452DRAFT_311859 [Aplosporella prunicola CBS 121167]|uniref:Retrotransposon gag domain-containing protein n=1 Tax=Aplosporella prunicola CBS 121167 TaxID=1176127 RepID=A0A6A6B5P0_9PEZI|nr:uncharacterized protein K452DRAFT_311859 [Aplosporella prunicola CBS 121167]KAF2138081.1 hypothetical protein K452DRAFT_311859 [Aplosporella prunicola CBS 121167]